MSRIDNKHNKEKCKKYKLDGRKAINKARKQAKRLKRLVKALRNKGRKEYH